ncbi:MAG: Solitary outer membrane autotransporter beta-barrel domain [Halioglobus sp.]
MSSIVVMRCTILTILAAASLSLPCLAQEQQVNTRSVESAYAQLVSFEAQPEIAAANFTVDNDDPELSDLDISTAKLPYYREFGDEGRRWFIQATASYVNMEETIHLQLTPGLNERLDASWVGYGALVEGGMIFPLTENIDIATSVGAGVSRLESEMDFTTPAIEDALAPTLDGVLYNWDTLASIVRASMALRYDKEFSSWRVKSSAHLSGSYVDSFEESDRFGGFTDKAGNLGLQLDVSHPTGVEIGDYPVFLIGHLGYTHLLGANRGELGFDSFGEAGLSFGVQKFTLGLLGILGSDVSGWSLQFNYDY